MIQKGERAMKPRKDSAVQWEWLLVCGVLAAVYLLL